MSDFLDIDDAPKLPKVLEHIVGLREQLTAFDAAWKSLSDRQRTFLETWQKCNYNERKAARTLNDETQTYRRWPDNEQYELCRDIMRKNAVKEVLNKERLALVQEEMVQSLMTPKPIFHQGIPVFLDGEVYKEIEASAAAKVIESQLRLGGHMKEDEQQSFKCGPNLVIQLTNRIGGEIISEVKVGIVPDLPAPAQSWLDLDDGT